MKIFRLPLTGYQAIESLHGLGRLLLLEFPAARDGTFSRFAIYLNFVAMLSFVGHSLFIPLFFHLEVNELTRYNIGAVVLYGGAWLINRRGYCYSAMCMMVLEYIVHAWLAVRLIGWDFGFQYFPLGWAWVPFMAPPGRKLTKIAVSVMGCGAFTWLTRYASVRALPPSAWQLAEAPLINVCNIAFFCCAIAFSFVVFRNYISTAEEAAREAHARSERLLHNILPVDIAERLKNNQVIADHHESASVLFLDIVDFTSMSREMNPQEVVSTLNGIFTCLDDLAEIYHIEKIKTVGDAYMVAAGIPIARHDHREVIGRFALDALHAIRTFTNPNGRIQIRIGIDSGAVVAGVIGNHKFIYDVWGDTVNSASRMESHGLSSRIQTSRRYHDETRHIFAFERRGMVDVKGMGMVETFLLNGLLEAPSPQ